MCQRIDRYHISSRSIKGEVIEVHYVNLITEEPVYLVCLEGYKVRFLLSTEVRVCVCRGGKAEFKRACDRIRTVILKSY